MVFFAFVINVFSRRVVGWQLASHMRVSLVCDALRMALIRRRHGADVQLIHHSDGEYVLAGCSGWSDRHSGRRERWIRSGREDAGAGCPGWPDPHSDRPRSEVSFLGLVDHAWAAPASWLAAMIANVT